MHKVWLFNLGAIHAKCLYSSILKESLSLAFVLLSTFVQTTNAHWGKEISERTKCACVDTSLLRC